MFPGVIAHPRVVPREGAVISGKFIPGGVRRFFDIPPIGFSLVDVFLCVRSADGRWPEFHVCASITAHL
jgi:hypothetical protein